MDTQFTPPTVGSKVEITFAFPSYTLNGPKVNKTILTGIVERATKFTPPNFVRLVLDFDSPVRIREIPLERILDIKYSDGRTSTKEVISTDTKTWTVEGSRGAKYLVVKSQNSYSCTCPGFQFRRNCKHVENIKNLT